MLVIRVQGFARVTVAVWRRERPWLRARKKSCACQLAFHGSRELVDMVYFCRRLAYVSRQVKFFSRWRLRALSE